MDAMDLKAMKQALANVKALAKRSIVDRYKAKKAPPPEVEAAEDPDLEMESAEGDADSPAEEAAEMPSDDDDGGKHTELIIMARGKPSKKDANMAKAASEIMPAKRKPGRPKKQQ